MTTGKLILFRLFNVTFGRFPIFSKLLKRCMIKAFIAKQKDNKYVASSKFFNLSDIEEKQ